jgi:Xaa-Pro aminopeptidase
MSRIPTLKKKIEQLRYDAYLVQDDMDIYYLTGIPNPKSPFLLVRPNGEHVLYIMRHALRTAKLKVADECEIKAADVGQSHLDLLLADLPSMKLGRVGFDALPAETYLRLSEKETTEFIPDRDTMWSLRMIKSSEEIEKVRRAAEIAGKAHEVAAEVLKPGMREYELAGEVERAMRIAGSEDEGHRTVVASGPRSTLGSISGYTTDRKIEEGDLVVVDTGATVNGYRSDMGRAYVAGKPTQKQKQMRELVENAWSAAFSRVKPGAVAGEIDKAARAVLGEFEKDFTHELGHGIGLSFEPPALGKNSKDVLKENMTVTVEPGIYVDGFGAILVEDTTVVVSGGAKRLTAPPLAWKE